MGRQYKQTIPADSSKIQRCDLTPDKLEVKLTNPCGGVYNVEVELVFRQTVTLPALSKGMKPMTFPRRTSTVIYSGERIDEHDTRAVQKKKMEENKRIYQAIVSLVRRGDYTFYTFPDGRLEFRLNTRNKA